jgi:CheY-like chemotaxis protein
MGGTIGVESEKGVGSTFWFTITVGVSRERQPAVQATPDELRDKHVLIVDDNLTNRRILASYVESWGCSLESVADGEEAILRMENSLMAGRQRIDLCLLDMMMPGLSGEAVARAIRTNPALAHIHIILLTSLTMRKSSAQLREMGIDGGLTKPIKPEQLLECVLSALGTSSESRRSEVFDVSDHQPTDALAPSSRRQALHILLVEDNPTNRMVGKRLLSKLGYRYSVAENGAEALQQLEAETFDVVLMDCQMPVMDGYAAARAIRDRESGRDTRLPIIALTANAMKGDRQKCLEAGMDDYLSKPLNPEQLTALLDAHLPEAP